MTSKKPYFPQLFWDNVFRIQNWLSRESIVRLYIIGILFFWTNTLMYSFKIHREHHTRIQKVWQRGVQIWRFFLVDEGREVSNKYHHQPASKTSFKWRFSGVLIMVQNWMLGSFVILQGIRTSIAKKPYIFVIFQGGLDPLLPTSWETICVRIFSASELNCTTVISLTFCIKLCCCKNIGKGIIISNDFKSCSIQIVMIFLCHSPFKCQQF